MIHPKETAFLKNWLEEHRSYQEKEEGKAVLSVLEEILADGEVMVEEAKKLQSELMYVTQLFTTSLEMKATQVLRGIIEGIQTDEVIKDSEIYMIENWLYQNDYLMGHYPYDKIKEAIDRILEDNIITQEEKESLTKIFDDILSPVDDASKAAVTIPGKEFVLTGDFQHGSRSEIEAYIVSKGGIVHSGVRKKADYVVVGLYGSPNYCQGNYGTKIKKAKEIGTTIIREEELYSA